MLPDHPIETAEAPADMFRATEGRWGSREVEITDVHARPPTTASAATCSTRASRSTIRIRLRSPLAIDDFVIGIGIFNAEGVCCYGTNTSLEDLKGERIFGDAEAMFTIESLDLVEGTYKLDVAVHKVDGYPYDYHRLLYTFRVKSRTKDVGIYRPRHRVALLRRRDASSGPASGRSEGRPRRAGARSCHGEAAAALVPELRAAGQTVVFTNGVFDLLHPGHRPLSAGSARRSATR